MSTKKIDQMREVERAARALIEKLFQGEADLSARIVITKHGSQVLRCTWSANGWTGTLELQRPGSRELSSKELAGVLALLAIDDAPIT